MDESEDEEEEEEESVAHVLIFRVSFVLFSLCQCFSLVREVLKERGESVRESNNEQIEKVCDGE